MKKVIILKGIPGSGKTRYAKHLAFKSCAVICSADKFFEKYSPGAPNKMSYEFDPKLLPEAHARCFDEFLKALLDGAKLVIVDNCNTRRWEYQHYEKAAKLAGYEVEIVEFWASTIDEVRLCADRNKHGVPGETIARKAFESEHHLGATVISVLNDGKHD